MVQPRNELSPAAENLRPRLKVLRSDLIYTADIQYYRYKVPIVELEAHLAEVPFISEAYTLSVSDRESGSRVAALVRFHPEAMINPVGWTNMLKCFSRIALPKDAPCRFGLVPRGKVLLRALNESLPAPDTPFWNAVAENCYGYGWGMLDNTRLCDECVNGASVLVVLGSYFDYFHFQGDLMDMLDTCTERGEAYIAHVRDSHTAGGSEHKVMDSWFATIQACYVDVLNAKASCGLSIFPVDYSRGRYIYHVTELLYFLKIFINLGPLRLSMQLTPTVIQY
ncbi:hypothetical protein FE257_002455 [Aspergillus nanangensis]|uniref:Uncharacterized protein n=1 Tax=Aspergillus nanangensis TaxID=2582783 RepID=A0AAD4GVT9_ASPNN|nr:hypothetical protein FE257_002455 [Aspergillus nanangensis]